MFYKAKADTFPAFFYTLEQIKMNFLPVGHTHEDIDGFFGVYSQHLDQNDVYTADGKYNDQIYVIYEFMFL